MGTEPRYEWLPAALDDPSRRCPDISRVNSVLGWHPRTPLAEGLRETKTYFAALREGASK
jgi:dTDP-glucose 4,6-dehydratase